MRKFSITLPILSEIFI